MEFIRLPVLHYTTEANLVEREGIEPSRCRRYSSTILKGNRTPILAIYVPLLGAQGRTRTDNIQILSLTRLPIASLGRNLAAPTGFEPVTFPLGGERSIH